MVAKDTPTFLELGRFVHLALHQYVLSVVLGECLEKECDSSARRVSYVGEGDGVGGGLLGEKGIHESRPP